MNNIIMQMKRVSLRYESIELVTKIRDIGS